MSNSETMMILYQPAKLSLGKWSNIIMKNHRDEIKLNFDISD